MQLHQTEQVFIADTFLQLFFRIGYIIVYLFQILQKPDGGRINHPQDQVQLIVHYDTFATCMLDKIRDEFSLVVTYRYDNFIIGNDAYWHGDKGNAMLTALHRDTQDG